MGVLANERIEGEGRLSLKVRVLLGFTLAALLILRVDTIQMTPAKVVAVRYLFSIERFEATNLPRKWLHLLWEMLPGSKPSREESVSLLKEYLYLARLAKKEKDRLEGLPFPRTALGQGDLPTEETHRRLDELLEDKGKLRARAEETLEAELTAVLHEEGLGSRWGLLFPPVDILFKEPPTLLVVSLRERLQLSEAVLLHPELKGPERDQVEKEILKRYNLSALVDDLAGLATYPAMVPDTYPLRTTLRNTAHEWLHHYFYFQPLGRHLRDSEEMFTLNETAADMAGRELGDMAFVRMGGDLSLSRSAYLSEEESHPFFTQELRKTRQRVEELLSQGSVEEAEQYMKERWWFLVLRRYPLRKLNQAYFAFRGRYAESGASISPIGSQLKEFRSLRPDVGSFIKSISQVSSYQEFVDLLERLKVQRGVARKGA